MHRPSRLALGLLLAVPLAAPAFADDDARPPIEAFALYQACAQGDTETVASLLASHPTLASAKLDAGVTPLHGAALADEPRTVDLLVARGAAVNLAGGPQHWTPLFLAAMKSHARTVRALLRHGADPNVEAEIPEEEGPNRMTPLHLAAINGRCDIADMLIVRGASLSVTSTTGGTPSDYCRVGRRETLRQIIEAYRIHGIAKGKPIAELLIALDAGDSTTMDRLLRKNPRLAHARLDDDATPLHVAAAAGSRAACGALLARGADPLAKETTTHWTAAVRANNEGYLELCEYLREFEKRAATNTRRK